MAEREANFKRGRYGEAVVRIDATTKYLCKMAVQPRLCRHFAFCQTEDSSFVIGFYILHTIFTAILFYSLILSNSARFTPKLVSVTLSSIYLLCIDS